MQVRLFAAAAAAAECEATASTASSLAKLRDALVRTLPQAFAEVLPQCSYFVDGVRYEPTADCPLDSVSTVDVLPPFAGG